MPSRKNGGLVCIIALIMLTTVLCYSTVVLHRSQAVYQIEVNARISNEARLAAHSALTLALQEVHTMIPDLTTEREYKLSSNSSARVHFSFGDTKTPSNLIKEAPYRVTLTVIAQVTSGYRQSEYSLEVVCQLVRRSLGASPPSWDNVKHYGFCQWGTRPSLVEGPSRLLGNCRFAGQTYMFPAPQDQVRRRFFVDLLLDIQNSNALPLIEEPVDLGPGSLRPSQAFDLQTNYGIATNRRPALTLPPRSVDYALINAYQLYPGGQQYTIPTITTASQIGTLNDNPLQIARITNGFAFPNSIRAMLIADSARVATYTTLESVELLPLVPPRGQKSALPTLVANHMRILFRGKLISQGHVVVDQLQIEQGFVDTDYPRVDCNGPLVTNFIYASGHANWRRSPTEWQSLLSQFLQDEAAHGRRMSFTAWLAQNHDTSMKYLTLDVSTSATRPHCPSIGQPIYNTHKDDEGLIWDIVRIKQL